MKTNSFMPNHWGSRDFHTRLKCKNTKCPLIDKGNYECGISSAVEIDINGCCTLYQKYLKETK